VQHDAEFEEWYRTHHAGVVTSLLLVSGNVDLARDAVDEAFTRAFARWDRVRKMDSPTGWTYRVAFNALRRAQRRAAVEGRLLARHRPAPDVPPPASGAWHLVRSLPVRQRTAVVLRYVADLTEGDIATAMGVTRGTVSSTLADARRHMAERIGSETDDLERYDV
jgi:RNA polymerase sigma-70 factor (ECF subfamily)